ncbi:MAG: leucyl aminopeptidase family protein [Gammaproteobacteria bacterium]|nr:leucyl aminopeptidase family protein [Gammaproteobacteria bacterium]
MPERALPLDEHDGDALPLHVVREGQLDSIPDGARRWADALGFGFNRGRVLPFPGAREELAGGVVVVPERDSVWDWAAMPLTLPPRRFRLQDPAGFDADVVAEGWALGSYRPDVKRRASESRPPARLVWPKMAERGRVSASVQATFLARDLINAPPNMLGPLELADACARLFEDRGACIRVLDERQLAAQGYAGILAVGAGSPRPPRVIDLRWGDATHPRVTLIGKGVCFDTGGLNLKNETGMRHMKKDMGGAAIVLGLAHMIVARQLPVHLRVLIAAVENSIDGTAMRPGDVITTRAGLTVEIGNTDAEGRVVMCELLAEADAESPDLLVDVATLTVGARQALGPDVGAYFAARDDTAEAFQQAAMTASDPMWRLPLHAPYRKRIDSEVADLVNIATNNPPGAIIAALFLADFVSKDRDWLHLDIFGWNEASRPGRPAGGEATGMRALMAYLATRYGDGPRR